MATGELNPACDLQYGLAFHPAVSRNTPGGFMLQKPGKVRHDGPVEFFFPFLLNRNRETCCTEKFDLRSNEWVEMQNENTKI